MTAQITNKTDSFTVYKDFRLSVLGEETVKLSKTFDDNSMNVTVKNNSSDSLTIKVTVGVYNDNDTLNTAKLQTVTLDSKAEQTISFAGITSDKSVSIFAWDKDMTPLTWNCSASSVSSEMFTRESPAWRSWSAMRGSSTPLRVVQ